MAYIECSLRSEVLHTSVDISMYFPGDLPPGMDSTPKGTLTLLHGYSNSGKAWMGMTAAQRYAADNSLVLICPSCQNSFYQDSYFGLYKTFLTQEMPHLLSKMFIFPTEREKNYIAGLSMGGYGALYLGLSRPDLYAGCASFSGAVDVEMLCASMPSDMQQLFSFLFPSADGKMPKDSDLYVLAERAAQLVPDMQPKILMTSGREDLEPYLIKQQNDAIWSKIKDYPFANIRRMEWTGVHEWNFWDRSLVYAIDYFFNEGYADKKMADWAHEPKIY